MSNYRNAVTARRLESTFGTITDPTNYRRNPLKGYEQEFYGGVELAQAIVSTRTFCWKNLLLQS